MYISKYIDNTQTSAKTDYSTLAYTPELNSMFRDTHFYTHPYDNNIEYGREQIEHPSEDDIANEETKEFKNYILLSRTEFFPRKLLI